MLSTKDLGRDKKLGTRQSHGFLKNIMFVGSLIFGVLFILEWFNNSCDYHSCVAFEGILAVSPNYQGAKSISGGKVIQFEPQKPDIAGLAEFLKPLNDVIVKAIVLTEGRRPDYFNHLKTAADSLTALAWIVYLGKDCGMSLPISHVEESWQRAEFDNDKVLVEYRNKDPNHVEWAKALKDLYLPGLRDYVKCYYPLGLSWAPAGAATTVSAPPLSTSISSVSKAPPAKAPAPPPPPPTSLFSSETPPSQPKSGMSAVFKEISSGKAVTSGLKKVTDDMKTKNRIDRTGVDATTEKTSRTRSFSFNRVGRPKLELQMGRKWAVENGKKNLIIEDCDSKQCVYVYGCKDSVLQVKGKVNNITVDKCTKMGIVFTDVVAACGIVNCNGVEVQCQVEHALPQQYIHNYKDGQFTTSPVSHSSGCSAPASQ